MKRIGIITMHKVLNYGSALQAWATQEVLKRTGNEVLIIDYIFPNDFHKKKHKKNYIQIISRFILHLILGFPLSRKKKRFQRFWEDNYQLTTSYSSPEELQNNPPVFDLYAVGSDQVWNPKNTLDDYSFFLNFVPKGKEKISIASSFAQAQLNTKTVQDIQPLLSDFKEISVREENGRNIIRNILSKDCTICLDPTLLLESNDYLPLIRQSKLNFTKPFILVYILQYAYNPYPYATDFIKEAHKQTGLDVVCIDFSNKQHLGIRNCTYLHDAIGPEDFVYLFSKAQIVITTSFHGTAFAINFGKSFYSIIDNKSRHDDRMLSLINLCGVQERAIVKDSDFPRFNTELEQESIQNRLNEERIKSLAFINKGIN